MANNLVKQAGILSAADFCRLVVKTIIGIILARVLTQADYGTYRQLFLIYLLIFSVFMMGLPQSIYYFVPRGGKEEQRKFLRQTLDLLTILGLIGSLILLFGRFGIGKIFNNPNLPQALLLYALYPFFMFISQLYYYVMIGLQQTRKAAGFTIFSVSCDFVLILGTALLTRNLQAVIAAVMISVIIQWIYARLKINPYCRDGKPFTFDRILLKEQLAYSLPIGVSTIIGVFSGQLDKLLVSSYFRPEQFAVFSVGAVELPFISILTSSVNSVILPEMNKKDNQTAITDLYKGTVRKNALLLFPLFVLCFLFAPHIIQILYSDKYSAAAVFFRIYLLTVPLRIATYSVMFQVFNQTKYIFIITGITLLANVGLSISLIHFIGIKGPAISSISVTYLSVLLYLILTKSKLKLNLKDLFPLSALGKTFLASILAGVLTYPILQLRLPLFWQLVFGSLLFIPLYYFIGNWVKAIQPYDNELLKNMCSSILLRLKKIF
ncbi:MAG TPA: oligosaccharide flippase family protein [Candidatus Cloacimonadota bacterium]|nr:oligosaccharide flippase family protein [Candidatus Cloacimonadota bacterium]